MSFKLSRDERVQRDALIDKLSKARGQVDSAIEDFNQTVEKAKEEVERALNAYNELLEETRGFCQDIAARATDEVGEKSDKWQEGERGSAAQEWAQEWEGADFSDAEIEIPGELDFDAEDAGEVLSQLPEEYST